LEKVYFFNIIPAYLQFFFIPGAIFLLVLNLKTNLFSFLSLAFAVSLVINYLVVFILSVFGIYNHFIIILIFFLELIYLQSKKNNLKKFFTKVIEITKNNFTTIKNKKFIYLAIALCLFGIFLNPIFSIFKDNIYGYSQVFLLQDVLEYYAKWARQWYYNNGIPQTVFFRPQMWSADISIVYKFFNNEYYEIFTKPIFNIIFIYAVLAIIGITLSTTNLIIFYGGLLGIYYSLTGTFTLGNSGYMEIPLALCMLFLVVFFYEIQFKKIERNQIIFLFPVLLSAIFLTKEIGWIFGIACIQYVIFYKRLNKEKLNFSSVQIVKMLFIFLLIFTPYYIYAAYNHDIFNFKNPAIQLLTFDTSIHLAAGHGERYLNLSTRIIDGLTKVPQFMGYLSVPLLINALFFISKDNVVKFVISPFVLVYFAIWLMLMSNEFRYLYPIIILVYLSAFVIIVDFIDLIKSNFFLKYKNLSKKIFFCFLIIFFVLIILTNKKIYSKNEILLRIDDKKIMYMNNKEQTITRKLRLVLKNEKIKSLKIITDIYLLKDLSFSFLDGTNIKYFENLNLINLNDYQYYLSTKNCVKFLNFDFIFKDEQIGCILKNITPK
jgi:hypothetical protein